MTKKLIPILVTFISIQHINCFITITRQHVLLELNETKQVGISLINFNRSDTMVLFDVEEEEVLNVYPHKILLQSENNVYNFTVEGLRPGQSDVAVISNNSMELNTLHLTVNVYKSKFIDILAQVFGWIFMISWGSSYYPQLYTNFDKKSVIGLNFDYLVLNLVGHMSFGIFILGLYFGSEIQMEYYKHHPRSIIPVKLNDVVYNQHGIIAILLTLFQCCIYERGNQKVSTTAKSLVLLVVIFYTSCIILQRLSLFDWLDFLYCCSYVKLVMALLKHIPQAYMNYKRKSTNGWSIGLVFLDLNGSIFSLLQIIVEAYNYNDWLSIFDNPTKFFLGVIGVLFYTLFIIQHYVLYRHQNYVRIP